MFLPKMKWITVTTDQQYMALEYEPRDPHHLGPGGWAIRTQFISFGIKLLSSKL